MNKETIKSELLKDISNIVEILEHGNTAEIKVNKDGILILEVSKKKTKKTK